METGAVAISGRIASARYFTETSRSGMQMRWDDLRRRQLTFGLRFDSSFFFLPRYRNRYQRLDKSLDRLASAA